MLLEFILAATIVPSGQVFACTPIAVWDGDGPVWCAEGPRVRLAGIAARETDGSCRRGHPCPPVSAAASKAALIRLLGTPTGTMPSGHTRISGPTLRCVSDGQAGGNRTAAWCVSPRFGDINCAMVNGGWAAKWQRYWRGHNCNSEQ
ncbi:hypothetical protein EYB45_10950 [Erythrobacteraceae bacterium CFH 75059]|nr:hypothetical protein EYB45_10950 [Erythrobacteraceae bacterium CFH 75059]